MSTMTMTNFRTSHPSQWQHVKGHITEWQRRWRSRHELEGLSDASLRDIGITRCEVHRELQKPFWMA